MTGSYTDASTDAYGLDALLLSLLRVFQQMLLKAMNLDEKNGRAFILLLWICFLSYWCCSFLCSSS